MKWYLILSILLFISCGRFRPTFSFYDVIKVKEDVEGTCYYYLRNNSVGFYAPCDCFDVGDTLIRKLKREKE